jgi:hypothetical protein
MADRDWDREQKVTYKSRVRPVDDDREYSYQHDRRYKQDYRDRGRDQYYERDYRDRDQDSHYYADDYRRPPDGDRGYGRRETLVKDEVVVDRRQLVDRDVYDRDMYYRDRDRERERDLALVTRPRASTRTEYDMLSDRDDFVTRSSDSNVIVLDSRSRGSGGMSDWEIIRPEKTESGAIIIEATDLRGGRGRYEVVATGRDQSVRSRSIVDAMRDVRVTEDVDDDRRSVYGRDDRRSKVDVVAGARPDTLRRIPTALRHDHSPSSDVRRRSRSIGFYRSEIKNHDVWERKHERPGAEAAIAGRYLVGHRGEHIDDDDFSHAGSGARRDRSRSRRRRKHRSHHDDDDDYERRDHYHVTERHINDTFVERTRPYSPQRAPSPDQESDRDEKRKHRRHRRHRSRRRREEKDVEVEEDDDDRKSYYSERYTKTKREYD